MKKVFLVSGLALSLILSPLGAKAEKAEVISLKELQQKPEEFVQEYVNLGMLQDYEGMVDLVIDERFPNEDKQTKLETYKMLHKDLPALIDYEIQEVKDVTKDRATVLTVLKYEDGSIEQAPMHLVRKDADWKLHLGKEDATEDLDYKQIKQSDIISETPEKGLNKFLIAPMAGEGPLTMSFDYWARAGGTTFYSNATFDTKVKNRFTLIATQSHDFPQSSYEVRVNYSIVQPGGFFTSDKVWGSATKTGRYESTPFVGGINRASGAPRDTNAKLRFQTDLGFTHSMGYKGKGSLYEY